MITNRVKNLLPSNLHPGMSGEGAFKVFSQTKRNAGVQCVNAGSSINEVQLLNPGYTLVDSDEW